MRKTTTNQYTIDHDELRQMLIEKIGIAPEAKMSFSFVKYNGADEGQPDVWHYACTVQAEEGEQG